MTDIETSDLSSVKKPYSSSNFAQDENTQGNGDCVQPSFCEKAQHPERVSAGIIEEMNQNDSTAEDDGKETHNNWVMNAQLSEQQKLSQNQSSTTVKKDKQQRIQFKIGKKRKKSSSEVISSTGKRCLSASHHLNVLDDGTEKEPDASHKESTREDGSTAPMTHNSLECFNMQRDDTKYNTNQQEIIHSTNDKRHPSSFDHVVETITYSEEPTDRVEQGHPPKDERNKSTSAQSCGAGADVRGLSMQATAQAHALPRQPDGWRVKLYRLNADGSWDDCGTGRIVFLADAQKTGNNRVEPMAKRKEWDSLEEEIYHILGLPTLCMHAEIPTHSQCHLTGAVHQTPKVLLRTRVLLRESYQRQGDNIITWCEPFFFPIQNKGRQEQGLKGQERNDSREEPAYGVDLALSFQDNAGCRDIWNKISKIQHKAYELFKSRGGVPIDRGDDGLHGYAQNQYNHKFYHSEDRKEEEEESDSTAHTKMRCENSVNSDNQQEQTHEGVASHNDSSESSNNDRLHSAYDIDEDDEHEYSDSDTAAVISMAAKAAQYAGGQQIGLHGKNHGGYQNDSMDIDDLASLNIHLCNPPNLENLEKIADVIAACQVRLDGTTVVIHVSRLVHHSHTCVDV